MQKPSEQQHPKRPPSLGLSSAKEKQPHDSYQEGKRSSARSRCSSVQTAATSRSNSRASAAVNSNARALNHVSSNGQKELQGDKDDVGSAAAAKKRRKKKWSDEIRVDLSCCKYEVLRIVVQKLGWQEAAGDDKGWHVFWTDTSIGPERLMTLQRGQKVNHFLGMLQICRKKPLARHLANMRRMFPAEYKFFPRAFILPNHIQELVARLKSDKVQTYILKPDNGCQGRGVVLVQNVADLKQAIGGMAGSNMLAQKYLTNPMLLNGYKFDLRIYVLILSCDPLRLFLYREGLVRFCTEKYMKPEKANLKLSCMHLTNYAVNKNNTNFEFNSSLSETDKGSKWTLGSLYKALAAKGYDIGRLKRQIRKMVVMTIISIVPLLVHNYRNCLNEDDNGRSCFELLGMDVLLDDKCKPWLLEVNHSPSFAIDTPLDFKVKESLLSDTLRLLNVDPSGVSRYKMQDKKGSKMRLYGCSENSKHDGSLNGMKENAKISEYDDFERKNLGNFDRVYPPDDATLQKLYDIFLSGSEEIFKQSFDMKIKNVILKTQEIRKREEMEKEAAEKKKLKKLQDMRKKAQETAKLAALTQQHQQSLLENNIIEPNSNDALNDIKRNIIYDIISPQSSMETPTGWEVHTVEKVSERDSVLQPAEDKCADVSGNNVQQETSASSVPNHFVSDAFSSEASNAATVTSRVFHQPIKYDQSPSNTNSKICSHFAIPKLASLPCVIPRSLYRRPSQRLLNNQTSYHGKRQDLGESIPVHQQVVTGCPVVVARGQLAASDARDQLVENDASFLYTKSYHGKFHGFRKSPFPACSVHYSGLFGECGNFITCDSYVPSLQLQGISTNYKCGVKNGFYQGLRGITKRNMQ